MKRKLLCIISILILITACGILIGCKGKNSEAPRVRGDAIDSDTVMNKALGFVVTEITTADEYVADAEIRKQNDGVSIKAYSDGTTMLTAYDWWGNTATVEVVVENSKITELNISAFSGNVANVMFFGAKANGVNDDSAAIKKAIDSLSNGGIVYFPAGTYLAGDIELKEGIHLRLQGKTEDRSGGWNDELAQRVKNGEFAVIESNHSRIIFINHAKGGPGTEGVSNISVVGGMVDLNGALASGKAQIDINHEGFTDKLRLGLSTSGNVITCAENILFENIIFKDAYNSHVFQVAGVKNLTIKDCMFVGQTYYPEKVGQAGTINKACETIQIEFGKDASTSYTTFEPGECFFNENVTITGCYFGDSDKAGNHLTPVGQHAQNGEPTVIGLEISNNIFDDPYYCGIRILNMDDVVIKNNIFISTQKGMLGGALISLYSTTGDRTHTGPDKNGNTTTVISSLGVSNNGLTNVQILDNQFKISGTSDKRAVSVIGSGLSYGAQTVSKKMLQVKGTLYGESYTGFVPVTNIFSNITLKGNRIDVSSIGCTDDYTVLLRAIKGITVTDNTITGMTFSSSYNGNTGVKVLDEITGNEATKLTIQTALTGKYIYLPDGNGGTIKMSASSTTIRKLMLYCDSGISLGYVIDDSGNITVKVTCDAGKTFSGWYTSTGTKYTAATAKLSANLTLTARVK